MTLAVEPILLREARCTLKDRWTVVTRMEASPRNGNTRLW